MVVGIAAGGSGRLGRAKLRPPVKHFGAKLKEQPDSGVSPLDILCHDVFARTEDLMLVTDIISTSQSPLASHDDTLIKSAQLIGNNPRLHCAPRQSTP